VQGGLRDRFDGVSKNRSKLLEEHTMHTMFSTAIARQIVSDRVRAAESGRRVRLIRSRGTALR
jgi:hypothetical protein